MRRIGTPTLALLVPLSRYDEAINADVQAEYQGRLARYLDATNELGGPRANAPVALLFAATLVTKNTKLQDAAFTSLQSLTFAGAASYTLKYTLGRKRPGEGTGARHLAPFSGSHSFPSGHTTSAFAIVTPWVVYYPHPVTYGLFALSTGTAVARLARNKHWPTDVAEGAALGISTGYLLAKRHKGESGRVQITPVASPEMVGFEMKVKL